MDILDAADFARLFGATTSAIRAAAGELIDAVDLGFRRIEGAERDKLILQILKRIHASDLKNAGSCRKDDWESGWRENLREFVESGYDLRLLIPKYYKQNVPIRLLGEYVLPAQADFVYRYTEIFRAWLFREYLGPSTSVYEFGCGTGHNLFQLATLWPDKLLFGFDWARSSQDILKTVAQHFGFNLKCGSFDFFAPQEDIRFESGSAVFTLGALEQIGSAHQPYLDFLLGRKPQLCIDVAGIHELYDPDNLVDYLALLYHTRRNYLRDYLTRLRALETSGRIEIVKIHRQRFGNLFDDPYSYIVWRPL